MPGPMSAPNGDKSIVSDMDKACLRHGFKIEYCQYSGEDICPTHITKREWLLRRNKLFSGKTSLK